MKLTIAVCFAALFSTQVYADVPASPCDKPTVPGRMADDLIMKSFNRHVTAYKACVNKYIDEQRELTKKEGDPAQAVKAHDAAEAAIKEYNDFMAELAAQNGKVVDDGKPKE